MRRPYYVATARLGAGRDPCCGPAAGGSATGACVATTAAGAAEGPAACGAAGCTPASRPLAPAAADAAACSNACSGRCCPGSQSCGIGGCGCACAAAVGCAAALAAAEASAAPGMQRGTRPRSRACTMPLSVPTASCSKLESYQQQVNPQSPTNRPVGVPAWSVTGGRAGASACRWCTECTARRPARRLGQQHDFTPATAPGQRKLEQLRKLGQLHTLGFSRSSCALHQGNATQPHAPVAASHTQTEESMEQETSSAPSAENTRPVTSAPWNCVAARLGRQGRGGELSQAAGDLGRQQGRRGMLGRDSAALVQGGIRRTRQAGRRQGTAQGRTTRCRARTHLPQRSGCLILHVKHDHCSVCQRDRHLPAVRRQRHVLQAGKEGRGKRQRHRQDSSGEQKEGLFKPPAEAGPRDTPRTWGVSRSLTQLIHWPLSRAHSRTQSSNPKVASRRAASEMQPPSTESRWPARGWVGGWGGHAGPGAGQAWQGLAGGGRMPTAEGG